MSLTGYFTCLVLQILLLCHETVLQDPAFIKQPQNPSSAREGKQLILQWSYNLQGQGFGSAAISNVTNGINGAPAVAGKSGGSSATVLPAYQHRFSVTVSDTQATLTFLALQGSDSETKYQLQIQTGSFTTINSDVVDIIVLFPSVFTNKSGDQEVREFSNLVLFCEASGFPPPNITWVKESQDGSDDKVLQRGHNSSLRFGNINSNDAGTYRCTAFNGVGNPVMHTFDVTVNFLHEIVLLSKHYIGRGMTAYLHCEVKGYPSPTIKWTPCSLPDVCDKSFLNISNVQTGVANYSCEANNSQGHVSANTSLIIGGNNVYLRLMITGEECIVGDQSFLEELKAGVDKIFMSKNGYTKTELLSYSCGSIIVDLVLRFSTLVAEDFVVSTLQNAVKADGKLGELSINVSSIVGIPPVIRSTTVSPPNKTTPKPTGTNTLAIVIGVLGGILLLVIIVVSVICCVRMKKKKESKEVDDKGPRRDQPPGGDRHDGPNNSDYDYAGKPSTLSMPPPKPARQGNDQGVEIPMYAQVDKSKKKPKAPSNNYTGRGSPNRREREELQYSTIDHSNQGGSMPRGPGNQLRRPPAHTETHYAELV